MYQQSKFTTITIELIKKLPFLSCPFILSRSQFYYLKKSNNNFILQIISIKHSEKLEVTIHELNVRIEELNRTIVDITSHKTRIHQVYYYEV